MFFSKSTVPTGAGLCPASSSDVMQSVSLLPQGRAREHPTLGFGEGDSLPRIQEWLETGLAIPEDIVSVCSLGLLEDGMA